MALSNAAKAGVAIFVGAVQFGFFLIVAEAYYPGYNVASNYVSDLGADCTSGGVCIIYQPTSLIFNTSIALLGLLILLGAYFFHSAFHWKPATGLIALAGIGALGVGTFPETTGIWHEIFSIIVFLFAGLAAVVVSRFVRKPLSYFSIILGLVALVALLLFLGGVDFGLGVGGMERMIVYPVLLWAIGFGGYLMGMEDKPKP